MKLISKEVLFRNAPHFLQNIGISVFNTYQYKIRYSGEYQKFRKYYSYVDSLSEDEVLKEVEKKKVAFFNYVKNRSVWYSDYDFHELSLLPVLEKKNIIEHFDSIRTINEKKGVLSFTGGTTGASMKVVYTKSDIQERFAILDHFRAGYGYKLGKKTAWFSGKNLITEINVEKGICSHYDFINNIRFYSTFHINQKSFNVYWDSLKKFQPEFIVGFPSSVYEICEIADSKGLSLDSKVKVFFPTAETVLPKHREVISRVLGCRLADQYASSEGAPFIIECKVGNLHIHPFTGIFEVVDSNTQPIIEGTLEGELLVTSFTTHGTPLIRYRIGDNIRLSKKSQRCSCGSAFPLVDSIHGRSTDYILSPTHGKINLGNISNSTKSIKGIIKFQVIQNDMHKVHVLVVVNKSFTRAEENKFKSSLAERLGPKLKIFLEIVDKIPNEQSGKFRIVKNNIKL